MAQLLSVGTIIDRAWSHYTKHFLTLMGISCWLLLIAILNVLSIWISPDTLLLTGQNNGVLSLTQIIGLIVYGVTFFLLTPVLSIWISNQLVKAIDQQMEGTTVNTKALGRFGWKYFFPRLLIGFLMAVIILAPFLAIIPGGALSVVAGLNNSPGLTLLSTLLIFLGVVAASIGCVYMAVRLVFAPFTLLIDNHRGRKALRESTKLSRGRFWSVCFRVVIPAVVFYIGMTTVQVILLYVMKTIILSVAGLNASLASQLFNIGRSTLFIVLNTVVAPLIVCANAIVYRDLTRNR